MQTTLWIPKLFHHSHYNLPLNESIITCEQNILTANNIFCLHTHQAEHRNDQSY